MAVAVIYERALKCSKKNEMKTTRTVHEYLKPSELSKLTPWPEKLYSGQTVLHISDHGDLRIKMLFYFKQLLY